MNPHKVTLRFVFDTNGKQVTSCDPSKRDLNRIKIGQTIRFEAADQSNAVEVGFSGVATFTPAQKGKFFQEFTAATVGDFEFGATLTLPNGTVVEWAPGSGGQGEVL